MKELGRHAGRVLTRVLLGGELLSAFLLGGLLLSAGAARAASEPQASDTTAVQAKIGSADTLAAHHPPVEPPPGATPFMIFAQIEQGWRAGAPELVVGCLANESIQIELAGAGPPPGRFACPQAEFLIRDLLHYGDTMDFRLTRFEWKGENPQAEAEWRHRMGTAERTLKVEIELAHRAGSWRVVRITSR